MSDQQTENVKQPENWVEHSQLSTASQAKTRAEIEQEIDAANEPSLIPRDEQITQCLAEYLFLELANGTVWRKMKEQIVQHHLATDGTGAPSKTKKSPGRTKKTNPDAPVADDRIYQLPISQIKPCPLNPRKRYNAQGITEFAENIRKVGIIHALLVRPVGVQVGLSYEVIAGHRRLMAATQAGLETAPCLIKEISDEEALDLMLSENLQRMDLTPIEEAEGLQSMLELKDLNEAPLYTRETLAQKLGKSPDHIFNCLRLLRLPKKARTALEEGGIGVSIGYLIAKLPTVEMRDRLTKEVLTGYGDGRPLTAREVNDTIARTYMVELKTAPFDISDANLGPALHMENGERVSGGACSDCPWNSANREDVESKFHLCMNPACFMAKVQAHTSRVKQRALDSGALVVEGEKADRLIHHDGTPRYDSGFVRLDAKPEHGEIVGGKKAPPWKKMLAGMTTVDIVLDRDKDGTSIKGTATAPVKVQPVVVIDSKGVAHELVERKLAIEAAKKNGYEDLFCTHASRAKSSIDANRLKADAEENRKKKIQRSEVLLALRELTDLITAKGVPDQAWFAMLEVVLQHAGADGEALVITRREIPIKKVNGSPDKSKSICDYAEKRLNHGNEMAAFIIELLVAGLIRWQGIRAACFKKVAAVFELPLDGVEQKVKFEMAAAAKKKEKPEEIAPLAGEKKPPVISAKQAAATAKKIRFGSGPEKPKKKALSAQARARIVAQLKARWAHQKQSLKKS